MAYNYRNAKRNETLCNDCQNAKERPRSGRLECPLRGNYQVGRKTTCDRVLKKEPA